MKTIGYLNTTILKVWAVTVQLLMPCMVSAAIFTATSSGSWSSSATWGGTTPGSDISLHQIIIPAGVNVIMDTDLMMNGPLASLDVQGSLQGSANTITVISGSIIGAGQMLCNQVSLSGSASVTFAGQLNVGTFVNNGATVALSALTSVQNELQLNGGVVVIGSGTLALQSGTQIVVNGGSMSLSGGLFTATDSYSVIYQGNGGTVGIEASGSGLSEITVDLSSANAQLMLGGDLVLNGDLTLDQGQVVIGNNSLTINGFIVCSPSGSIDASMGSALQVSANGNGTIELSFASSPDMIGSLTIDASGGASAQLEGDLEVVAAFNLNSGTFNLNGNSLTVAGDFNGQGTFQANAGSSVAIQGSGSISGGLDFGSSVQVLESLSIDISSSESIAISGSVDVTDVCDLQSGGIVLGANSNIGLNGSVSFGPDCILIGNQTAAISINSSGSVNGALTFDSGSSVVGDLSLNIGGNGSISLGSDLGVEGELGLEGGTCSLNGFTLTINGDIASGGSGSISGGGSSGIIINASGDLSGALTFSAGSAELEDLTINIQNGGSVMLGSDVLVSGTLDLQNGFVAIGNSDIEIGGAVTGGSANSYVITEGQGSLILAVSSGGQGYFPVGTSADFCPATLTQASGSASGNFGVSAMAGVLANGYSGIDISQYTGMVNTTWMVISELTAGIDLALTLEWAADQQTNNFSNTDCYISHYTNAAWDASVAASATLNTEGRFELTRSGFTSLSPFAVFHSAATVGIEGPQQEVSISFFPNPTKDVVMYDLTGNEGMTQIDVFDLHGKLVETKSVFNNRGVMDMGGHPAGVYTIRVTDERSTQTAWLVRQ